MTEIPTETDNIVEGVVNSVLESDHEVTPSNSRSSSVSHRVFSDGLTFIRAVNTLQKCGSPLKALVAKAEQKWVIWYWKRSEQTRSGNWEDFLQKKSSFTTKNDFWSVSHEISGIGIELLSDHFDCCVFKEGIKPMWEDSDNKNGGRWLIQVEREHCWKHVVNVEEMWLKVVLLITGNGEVFPNHFDNLCGAVLMVRHDAIKIAVWTKDANNTLANLGICQLLKKCTGFAGAMSYERHTTDTGHSRTRIRFRLPKKKAHRF